VIGGDIHVGDLISHEVKTNPGTYLVLTRTDLYIPWRNEILHFLEFEFFDMPSNRKIKMHLSPERDYNVLRRLQDTIDENGD
jgi:hypothetical protein